MKKETIYKVVILVIVMLVTIVVAVMWQSATKTEVSVPATFPDARSASVSTRTIEAWKGNDEPGITKILGRDGTIIRAQDFLNDADTYELSDDGIYVISTSEKKGSIGDSYTIFYDDFDGSIVISLRSTPLYTARISAEATLKQDTGLSEDVLCGANIVINTPREVSDVYSGRNLGLSFCPNSVLLE